jgi:peptidoglycan/xylan/chitin deacetylase (PgdA/CDA1 family)
MRTTLKNFIIGGLEKCGVLGVARFLTRHHPRILMYHRIVDNKNLPGISVDVFEQQLIYIKQHFNVVSLNHLLNELKKAKRFKRNIAITFDDGHKDFFQTAWPLLKKHDIPATLFVTTGFVDRNLWLWPDLLRYILLSTKVKQFDLEKFGSINISSDNVLAIWNTLGDYCLTLSQQQRTEFLNNLAVQLDVVINNIPQNPFDAVSWDDLRAMYKEGLDIGSHSVSHPIFSALESTELIQELEISKQRIIEEIGAEPTGICYPNGMAKDTSPQVEMLAKQFYQYGLVAYPAPIDSKHIMHIGRYSASNKMQHFKWLISGLSRNNNQHGEYK